MRIGEVRNIVEEAANSSDQLEINSEPLFGGQAYTVTDYASLVQALEIISDQEWNTLDFSEVETVIAKHGKTAEEVQLTDTEYSYLNSYVSSVNSKFPIYLEIVRTMTKSQEEQAINVKLPESIKSLQRLSTLNKDLTTLFKEFAIDGEVKFVSFDTGSSWYVLLITGVSTYHAFIACLKIAQEIMKLRAEYYKSETAKVEYETARAIYDQKFSEEKFEEYQDKKIELMVENKVREALASIHNSSGKPEIELHSQLVMATKSLVKELGDGVEFHLSLNPPDYAKEKSGSLQIDYSKIRAINDAREKPKQIVAKKQDPPEEKTK